MNIIKQIFYLANIGIFILYLSPCSLLGYLINKDCKLQPQFTGDFIISTNHAIAFALLSLIGLNAFKKNLKQILIYLIFISILGLIAFKHKLKNIFIYLICISIILEILHLIIPERGFELGDLFGNIIGVFISFLVFKIIYKGRLQ